MMTLIKKVRFTKDMVYLKDLINKSHSKLLNDPNSHLNKDLKNRMVEHVLCIEECEEKITMYRARAREQRVAIKKIVKEWDF